MINLKNKLFKCTIFLLLAILYNSSQSMDLFKKISSDLLKDCAIEICYPFAKKDRLLLACRLNKTKEAKKLIEKKVPIHKGCLLYACKNNNPDLAKLLFEEEAPIHEYCIHYACENNDPELVELLCCKGVDPDSLKNTPTNETEDVHYAFNYGVFKEIYPTYHIRIKTIEKTPLYIAAEKGYIQVAEILLRYGADINQKSYAYSEVIKKEVTPLTAAIKKNQLKMVNFLIKSKVNAHEKLCFNYCDELYYSWQETFLERKKNYKNPLHIATENGRVEIAKILIKNGANVNQKAKLQLKYTSDDFYYAVNMQETLLLAAYYREKHHMVQFLLKNGAKFHEKFNYEIRIIAHRIKKITMPILAASGKISLLDHIRNPNNRNSYTEQYLPLNWYFSNRKHFSQRHCEKLISCPMPTYAKVIIINHYLHLNRRKLLLDENILKAFGKIGFDALISFFGNTGDQFRLAKLYFTWHILTHHRLTPYDDNYSDLMIVIRNDNKISKEIENWRLRQGQFAEQCRKLIKLAKKYNLEKRASDLENTIQVYKILTHKKIRNLKRKPTVKQPKKRISQLKKQEKHTKKQMKERFLTHKTAKKIIAYAGINSFVKE